MKRSLFAFETRRWIALLLPLLLLAACSAGPAATDPEVSIPAAAATAVNPAGSPTTTPSALPSETATATLTPFATPTPSATPTATATPTQTVTPTPVPTYVKLRGKVIVEQAVCHYGPGKPYLYKYGVYLGSNLEILRRVEPGDYVEVQAIGGNNPCWLNAEYLDIQGDLSQLEPVSAADVKLPITPYYKAPTGVSAVREGDDVVISWHPVILRAGDEQDYPPYVVEVWVCQDGEIQFLPLGVYQPITRVVDQPGCDEPSRGFLAAAEKHGYMPRVPIPWPAANQ